MSPDSSTVRLRLIARGPELRALRARIVAGVGQIKARRVPQLYLGHKNIQRAVRYTELAAGRFKDFWKD